MKCTQYGICSQAVFKNARAMFFSFSGAAGSYFRAGLKKIRAGAEFFRKGCPCPNLESLLVRGGYLTSSLENSSTRALPPSCLVGSPIQGLSVRPWPWSSLAPCYRYPAGYPAPGLPCHSPSHLRLLAAPTLDVLSSSTLCARSWLAASCYYLLGAQGVHQSHKEESKDVNM